MNKSIQNAKKTEQELENVIEFISSRDLDESYDWFRESSEDLSDEKELERRLEFISSQSLAQDFEIFKNE